MTICTADRECLFGEICDKYRAIHESPLRVELSELGKIVDIFIKSLPKRFPNIELDEYVIMPNHVHMIINIVGAIHESPAISKDDFHTRSLLSKIIGFLKMNSSKFIHAKYPNIQVWQRNYYEHIIRDEGDLNRIQGYIENNPSNWSEDELFV